MNPHRNLIEQGTTVWNLKLSEVCSHRCLYFNIYLLRSRVSCADNGPTAARQQQFKSDIDLARYVTLSPALSDAASCLRLKKLYVQKQPGESESENTVV